MNKIYKIVWNKTKNCYVVASELAKSHTKGSGTRSFRMKAVRVLGAMLVSVYLVSSYGVQVAWADEAGVAGSNVTRTGANASAWGNNTQAGSSNATAWGLKANAGGANATAWGNNTVANGINATVWGIDSKAIGAAATAFGDSSVANGINSLAALGGITAEGATGSVAIGDGAKANLAHSIALGNDSVANRLAGVGGYRPDGTVAAGTAWISTDNAVSVGASATNGDTATVTRQITGVAAGTYDTDAVNVAQLKAAMKNAGGGETYTAGNGINIDTEDNNKISVNTGEGLEIGTSGKLQVRSGTVAGNSDGFIKGEALYMEVRPADGTYVKEKKTTAANLTALDTAVKNKADKATTLKGYGITDAYTKAATDSAITKAVGGKADKATTLKGYGITDAYTKEETNSTITTAVAGKADRATTLGGYGITDAYTKAATDSAITKAVADKADKATTLGGYGITDAYTKTQVDAKETALSNRIGTISKNGAVVKAGNTVSENLTALDTSLDDVKKTAEETKTDLQLIAKVSGIELNAIIDLAEEINERTADIETIKAMDGTVVPEGEPGADEFLRGSTVYEEVRPADGTYVKEKNTTAANLTALDTAVKNKADKATTLEGYGIRDAYTKTATDNAIADAVKNKADKSDTLEGYGIRDAYTKTQVDAKETALANRIGTIAEDGLIIKADKNIAENLTLMDKALQDQTGIAKDVLDQKANTDASNVGKNAKDANGSTADNSAAWGSALGTGEVESGNEKLVTGATVYEEVRLTEDGEYVKMDNTVAENLTALDDQARVTAEAVASNAEMITENARNIDKNTLDITTNARNIAKNTQNIASNTENITQNTQDIATNADNIVTAQKTADTAMAGVSMLLVGTGISIEGIIATDQKVNDLAAQDGKITAQGEKADEFTRGVTVYEYLNGKPGEEGSLRLGENTTKIAIGKGSEIKSGTRSVALGFDNTVDGDQNIAIGTGHTLKGNNNIVLGNNVQVNNVDNAVVLGNNSAAEADAVSVGSSGGERQIKHVAPGTEATDAATIGQLQAAGHKLDNRVNKVGAGAAALAALHPLDMDGKFGMGLGYGNYRNANAMAMGLFYQPKDNLMFSIGGSMGNGENMVNAGVIFALDKGKGLGASKAAMARKIAAQDAEIAALKEAHQKESAAQDEKIAAQDAEIAALKEALARLEAKVGK